MLAHALTRVHDEHGEAVQTHCGVEVVVPDLPFPRLTMADAQQLLRENGWQGDHAKGDLDPEGERLLSSLISERHGHEFVFVTEYPIGVLVAQAREKGMELEPLRTYLDSFRYGTPPHGGLGAELNRIIMVLLGLVDSIRESTFLFRGPRRLHP